MTVIRHWLVGPKHGKPPRDIVTDAAQIQAYRDADWNVVGPFVLESTATEGAVSLADEVEDAIRALETLTRANFGLVTLDVRIKLQAALNTYRGQSTEGGA